MSYFGFIKIFTEKREENFFDRAWFTSFFVLFCSQMVDIEYFDGRISIIFWILLAGIKTSIDNINYETSLNNPSPVPKASNQLP